MVFGAILIAIFGLFSVLIVFNTVRVAIYTQREEIGIMRLVGASGSFVRLPFVLEGIFIALLASTIAAFIIAGAVTFVEPRLVSFFDGADPGLRAYFIGNLPSILAAELGSLFALVAVSSWAAVGKYLKR